MMRIISFLLLIIIVFQSCKNNEDISIEWVETYVMFCNTLEHHITHKLKITNNTDYNRNVVFLLDHLFITENNKIMFIASGRYSHGCHPEITIYLKPHETKHLPLYNNTKICNYDTLLTFRRLDLMYKLNEQQNKGLIERHTNDSSIVLKNGIIRKSSDYKIYKPGDYPKDIMKGFKGFKQDSIDYFESLNKIYTDTLTN